MTKDRVRQEQELVQQRDIEISSLNGKLQFLEEELELVKTQSGDVSGLEAEINSLRNKLNYEKGELEVSRGDNTKLSSELQQQQVMLHMLHMLRLRCYICYILLFSSYYFS